MLSNVLMCMPHTHTISLIIKKRMVFTFIHLYPFLIGIYILERKQNNFYV